MASPWRRKIIVGLSFYTKELARKIIDGFSPSPKLVIPKSPLAVSPCVGHAGIGRMSVPVVKGEVADGVAVPIAQVWL